MNRDRSIVLLAVFMVMTAFADSFPGTVSDSEKNVAIICLLDGKAWISDPSGMNRREANLFDWITTGAAIETAPGAKLVLAFSSGSRYELGEKAKVVLGQEKFASASGSVKKLDSVALMPHIASLLGQAKPGSRLGGIRLRGSKRTITNLFPAEGDSVLSENVVLSFDPLEGAEKYRVEIEDESGNSIFLVEITSPLVAVSPGVIKPGANYYWQVRSLETGKLSAVSYSAFVTVDQEHARLLKSFRAFVGTSKDVANTLLLARMELSLGLRGDACKTLGEALALFPDNAEIKNALVRGGCK